MLGTSRVIRPIDSLARRQNVTFSSLSAGYRLGSRCSWSGLHYADTHININYIVVYTAPARPPAARNTIAAFKHWYQVWSCRHIHSGSNGATAIPRSIKPDARRYEPNGFRPPSPRPAEVSATRAGGGQIAAPHWPSSRDRIQSCEAQVWWCCAEPARHVGHRRGLVRLRRACRRLMEEQAARWIGHLGWGSAPSSAAPVGVRLPPPPPAA